MRIEDRELIERVEHLIDTLQSHPDGDVVGMVNEMLQGIDGIHRHGLARLVEKIHEMAGEPFVNRLCEDPVIRLLLMSYDLVPVDRRIAAEEALDVARDVLGPLGIRIGLENVLGGVVTVSLQGANNAPDGHREAVDIIETALRENLPGFQELEISRPPARGTTHDPVQLGETRRSS